MVRSSIFWRVETSVSGVFGELLPYCCRVRCHHIVNGLRLRLGLGLSWAYLLLGELTGVPNGLGAVNYGCPGCWKELILLFWGSLSLRLWGGCGKTTFKAEEKR